MRSNSKESFTGSSTVSKASEDSEEDPRIQEEQRGTTTEALKSAENRLAAGWLKREKQPLQLLCTVQRKAACPAGRHLHRRRLLLAVAIAEPRHRKCQAADSAVQNLGNLNFFYSALLLRRVPAAAAAEYSEEYSHIGWIKVKENEDWSSLILVT